MTTRLWHPFAAMGDVEGSELVLERGKGARVWDAGGRAYLDATAGLWFANVGHGRAELAEAAATQMRELAAHHTFGDLANAPALALAERVADLAPIDDAAVFFCSGGSDAVERQRRSPGATGVCSGSHSDASSSPGNSPTTE